MQDLEFSIPKDRREAFWELCILLVMVLVSGIAVLGLRQGTAMIPSLIWLALVMVPAGLAVISAWKEVGLWRLLTDRLAVFVGNSFALYRSSEQPSCIRFGYRLFGWPVFQLDVPIHSIKAVKWSTGQATALAQRDMDDWQVVLWFDHGNPERSRRRSFHSKPEQEPYLVGRNGRKTVIESFGLEFVAFLRQAGADLIPGDADNVFIQPRAEDSDGW